MRLHVVSLPHTQTTNAFSSCAFTDNTRKFCRMMKEEGHTVFLYAGEQNEAQCDELITCITEDERRAVVGDAHYNFASFDSTAPHWRRFNNSVIEGIRGRLQERDIVCLIGGFAQKPIADALPDTICVEHAVGYPGTFAQFRVWASYAWMHTCYGCAEANATKIDGQWYDAVIPHFFEVEQFPYRSSADDYYLYVGRVVGRKGWEIAQRTCEYLGVRLIVAGPGDWNNGYGEYVGEVGVEERGRLMSGAIAMFAPTIYIEPFGNVVCEAQLCGTPVITSDWGAFPETVDQGVSGFRCRYLGEFVDAARKASTLDRVMIRERACHKWSLRAVGPRYTAYFKRLLTVLDEGIDTPEPV